MFRGLGDSEYALTQIWISGILSKGDFTEARFYVGYHGDAFAVQSRWFLFGGCTSSRKRTIHLFGISLGGAGWELFQMRLCSQSQHRSYIALSKVASAFAVREAHRLFLPAVSDSITGS